MDTGDMEARGCDSAPQNNPNVMIVIGFLVQSGERRREEEIQGKPAARAYLYNQRGSGQGTYRSMVYLGTRLLRPTAVY